MKLNGLTLEKRMIASKKQI